MIVNNTLPTSTLLDVKIGDYLESENLSGEVSEIDIQETDEYLMFLFLLDNSKEIIVRKLKQIC